MPFPQEPILELDFFPTLVDAILQITRGLLPLVKLGNASTCAEKILTHELPDGEKIIPLYIPWTFMCK